MKYPSQSSLHIALMLLFVSRCLAAQYEIRGSVSNESGQVMDALVRAAPTNNAAQTFGPVQTSNGTYALTLDLPQGTVVNVSSDRALVGAFGLYGWIRTVTLGAESVISNLNFTVPTVNTSKVSLTGQITIGTIPPQDRASIVLHKTQPNFGQEFYATQLLRIPGFPGTNTFKFFDLPLGDYNLAAKADSSSVTQIVISVTATNTPVQLNIDLP